MKNALIKFALSILFLVSFEVRAASMPLLSPDYYLGRAVEWILAAGSYLGHEEFVQIVDSKTEHRIENALNQILSHPVKNYRYKRARVILIKGVPGEPNAYSIGPVIYISWSLAQMLDDRQLVAVIAHELMHSEQAHLLQRVPVPLGAIVLSLYQGAASGRAQKLKLKAIFETIKDTIATNHLAMELQADCYAAQQLAFMHDSGLSNEPEDLIKATNRILGIDVLHDVTEGPDYDRASALVNKSYLLGCEY